ncbi:MAG: aldehyde ferredoxin oxidoreductase C-terminal domain-containing protein [Anaerolineaceae bacterium]|jgi:aldehyde:ferredoxin oxidoreductase|nr:aldehyde ferredoxin oxidoreductase C-terminal domain-containing protein [Anaerolineaceae bacterium]
MKILEINLSTGEKQELELPDPLMAGRYLSSFLVSKYVDPKTDPLGAENVLVFTTGVLANSRTSTGSRLSVGCKSPLTKGIKEANAGGMGGDSIAALGYRALVFLGVVPEGKHAIFHLDQEGGHLDFESAQDCWGKGNEDTAAYLLDKFGSNHCVISIGQAGERLMGAAGIAVTDAQGKPFRLAARGGVGAVMGSKGLKAITVPLPPRSGRELSKEARQPITAFNKHVATSERVGVLRDYGTASTVMPVQVMGGLPVRNFSKGQLPDATPISSEFMREVILKRGGDGTPTHACMTGCVIQCSNAFADENGELIAAPVEFETIGLCGSNLEIASLDGIAKINRLCNDYGMDTIETGATLGVMMDAAEMEKLPDWIQREDLPRFGDVDSALKVLSQVPQGTLVGNLVGAGVVSTGKALGVKHIPAVKGQAMSAYDPRVVKGTAVTYATSPQGADHTAGLTVFFPIDHRDPSLAVKFSRIAQIQRAAYDALNLCAFNTSATGQRPDIVIEMLRKVYQVDLPDNYLDVLGRKVIDLELAFNRAAGLGPEDDRIPEYFKNEALTEVVPTVFDVPDTELDTIWTT